jgi:uncharacterized membrane protein
MDNQTTTPPMSPVPPTPPPTHSTNTGMALLAYLGILIIIPFVTEAHKDPFVKFHLRQGLVLIILEVITWFLMTIPFGFMIAWLLWLGILVLIIIGVANAAAGKENELPVVGHWGSKFNF